VEGDALGFGPKGADYQRTVLRMHAQQLVWLWMAEGHELVERGL
jgi:hypothetical protein